MAPNPPQPGKDEFAQFVISLLREAGLAGEITYDAESFSIVVAERSCTHHLDNHYAEYVQAAPPDRREISMRYVSAIAEERPTASDLSPEDFRAALFPSIHDPIFMAELADAKLAAQPLSPFHQILLVVDHDGGMEFINDEQLNAVGLTKYSALPLAVENLRKNSDSGFITLAPGLVCSTWTDAYDPSRLLLPEMLAKIPSNGPLIAIMPHRDCLLLADSSNDEALQKLVKVARQEMEHDHAISVVPLIRHGDAWHLYQLPQKSGPGARALGMLALQGQSVAYNRQEEFLDAQHQAAGKEIYVVEFSLLENKAKQLGYSICTWVRDRHSLLPKTDLIALVDTLLPDDKQVRCMAWWADVEAACPGMLRPTGMQPERYIVDGFPAQAVIKGLKNFG